MQTEPEDSHLMQEPREAISRAIVACKKRADWQQALKLLAEMRTQQLAPGIKEYTAAVSACAWASQADAAVHLLRVEMPAHGVAPDSYTYSEWIHDASTNMQRLQTRSHAAHVSSRGVMSTQHCRYAAALGACTRALQWERALSIFGEADDAAANNAVVLGEMHHCMMACEQYEEARDCGSTMTSRVILRWWW